jgi:hypothetical protein
MNAAWTSSVKSLAWRLRPFFANASREHSCGFCVSGRFQFVQSLFGLYNS